MCSMLSSCLFTLASLNPFDPERLSSDQVMTITNVSTACKQRMKTKIERYEEDKGSYTDRQ